MSPITAVCASGILFGSGIYLAVTGLFPARPPLHEALGRLGQPQPAPPPTTTVHPIRSTSGSAESPGSSA